MSDDYESSGLLTDEVTEALDKLIEPVMAGKPIEEWAEASTDFIDAVIEVAAELGETQHERLLPPMARECADRATSATDVWMLRAYAILAMYRLAFWAHEQVVGAQAKLN
jgi:hypothetical protein